MSYYKEVMQPGEEVLYDKNLHWIVYLRAALIAAPVVLLGLYVATMGNNGVLFVTLLIALYVLIRAWVRSVSTEIVITNKRVLLKTGLIIRNTMEMNMAKVETVDVSQSVAGRLFNYGTVTIRGTGSTYEPLCDVASPIELRNAIIAR